MQILVVDDEPDIRVSLKLLLELYGHSVVVAANGQEAVDLANEHPPEVVFMDIKMPVMDGITATRMLRRGDKTRAAAIICVSAYLQQEDWRGRAVAAGCDDCLSKPLELSNLEQVLSRFKGRPLDPHS